MATTDDRRAREGLRAWKEELYDRLPERHPPAAGARLGQQLVQRAQGIERGEQPLVEGPESDRGEVVLGRRKAGGLLELGHELETPVEGEAPSVIAAAQGLNVAFAFDQ